MAESSLTEQHNPSIPNPNVSTDCESLPVPPLDPLFFSGLETYMPDQGFDDGDIEFTLFYFPSENEDLLAGDFLDGCDGSEAKDPSSKVVVKACDDRPHVANVTNSPVSSQVSVDQRSDAARVLDSPLPESGLVKDTGNRGCNATSSPRSGNCGSGTEAMNSPSPESGNCEQDVSWNVAVDQNIKLEEMSKNCLTKRKKEHEDANSEPRSSKFRRSSIPIDSGLDVGNDEEDKRKARLMRNRESAQISRRRKKRYVKDLEDKVRTMDSTVAELNSKISFIMAENASLRQQLSGGVICPIPPPVMYPHPPMAPIAYPWMPSARYVVKPQGSQVPLVPIPGLKPQRPVSVSKPKKSKNKKAEGKTKKAASITFLGLLFFILLFGGLVPFVNVMNGGIWDKILGGSDYTNNRFYDQHRGRIMTVNNHLNGLHPSFGAGVINDKFVFTSASRVHCARGCIHPRDEL